MKATTRHHSLSLALTSCLAACGSGLAPDEIRTEIVVLPAEIHDERGDEIDFATGEPVHTHAGPTVVLGDPVDACPHVYKYGYLLDREPAFGRQTTENPLAWRVLAPNVTPLDDTASAFRVLTEDEQILREWTPLGAPEADGAYTIALYRDDLPALGEPLRKLLLEVRFRDVDGAEQVQRLCWIHHALAAPLAFESPVAASTPSSLFGITLANDQPLAPLLAAEPNTPPGPIDVVEQSFVQQTAEPLDLLVEVSPPSGTFSRTILDTWIATSTYMLASCETTPEKCNEAPLAQPPPVATSGELTSGRWALRVLDPDGRVHCRGDAPLHCRIPGRAETEAPRRYHIVASAYSMTDLWIPTGPAADLPLRGTQLVAFPTGDTAYVCSLVGERTIGGQPFPFCIGGGTEYTRVFALGQARLDLAPIALTFSASSPDHDHPERVPYLPNGSLATPPLVWDGGNEIFPTN